MWNKGVCSLSPFAAHLLLLTGQTYSTAAWIQTESKGNSLSVILMGNRKGLIMELTLFSWKISFVSFTTAYREVLNASRLLGNDTNSNIFY